MDGVTAGSARGVHILFLPGLGGEDAGTRRLCAVLARMGEVHVLTLPDLETRCADIYDLPPRLSTWCDGVARKASGQPLILAGYSTGGVVGFLLARELAAQGVHVSVIVLFDTSAALPDSEPRYFLRQMIRESRKRFVGGWADAVLILFAACGWLDGLRLLIRLIARGGWSGRADTLRKRLLLYLWRRVAARLELGRTEIPTILFAAAKPRGGVLTPSRGWETHASVLTVVAIPGDHWTMLAEPQLTVCSDLIIGQIQTFVPSSRIIPAARANCHGRKARRERTA